MTMKKYLWLVLVLISFNLSYKTMADEVEQKTDGSFVGDNPPKPINSSFVGDDSKSVDNDSFVGEDVQKQTDSGFVGDNAINAQDSQFSGDSYQQQVSNSTVAPFSGDGTFVGKDYGK
jgi:hypothetical protein